MDLRNFTWKENENNPIIVPQKPGWMIADPTVLLPEESPDNRWHLFANSIPPKLHHFVSDDGVKWEKIGTLCPKAMRPYIRKFGDTWHLYYENVYRKVPLRSYIAERRSKDLVNWSDEIRVLEASLPWHGKLTRTCGNPCVLEWQGEYLLYYSANTVWLPDCLFVEPLYIGLARAKSLDGPWIPEPGPIIRPSQDDWFRNMGAGSIKVFADPSGDFLWGFHNGIYRDDEGRSRSSIGIFRSDDAVSWYWVSKGPIIEPDGDGWKKALVYAMDPKIISDKEMLVYFNARSGWFIGAERIGMASGTLA